LRGALAAGLVAISAGFAIRWLGAEGGRALEPWEAAAAAIAAESGARDTLVLYPGYAGHALLHHLGPGRPPQVLWASLRDESAAAAVAERLARGRGSGPATIWLVLRADLTSGVDERLLPRLAAAVARERGLRPVRALIVPSPDAALDARVVALRSRMAERLAAELGPPAPGAPPGDDRLLDLRFAPADGPELR
jgi:hypothetical protein